ncbi:diguanylate cyclase (GGDEF) domain-containing protein [Eubacterium ruminantium]|nr:diguanylate cyclase (GGDEF) domain-containing protein [Eubacterium ruminantium]
MGKSLKEVYKEQKSLRDKIFIFSLFGSIAMVLICAVNMIVSGNSLWTVIFNVGSALLLLMLFKLAFAKGKKRFARTFFVYFINMAVMTYLFYINGGVNSGMSIYLMAGLLIIVLSEHGVKRYIALVLCSVFHVVSIIISYNYMSEQAEENNNPVLIPDMDSFSEVLDTAVSLIIVGVCMASVLILLFNAYDKEKKANEELMNKLADMAITDELTGISNRRNLFNYLEMDDELFTTENKYIAMIDIDQFKKVNDDYGHLFGDEVLRRFGGVLLAQTQDPEVELAARYGGQEFLILFNADSREKAIDRINKIKQQLKMIRIEKYPSVNLTASAGLVLCKNHNNLTMLLKNADDCLFEAKKAGRDKIISSF